MPKRRLAFLWWLCLLLQACAGPSYYVVRSTFTPEPAAAAAAPELAQAATPAPRIERIAIGTLALTEGEQRAKEPRPAYVEPSPEALNQLERALVEAGFSVVGHDVVRDHARRHNQSLREAAQALGVTLLLRVNALAPGLLSERGRWQRTYHGADAQGSPGAPLAAPPTRADALDMLAARAEQQRLGAGRTSMTLDVTAESVSTGELLWFYRGTRSRAAPRAHAISLFVVCDLGTCQPARAAPTPSRRPERDKSLRLLQPTRTRGGEDALVEELASELAMRLKNWTRIATSTTESPALGAPTP